MTADETQRHFAALMIDLACAIAFLRSPSPALSESEMERFCVGAEADIKAAQTHMAKGWPKTGSETL